VAPQWALEKQVNLQAIRDALQKRHIWQGKAYEKDQGSRPGVIERSSLTSKASQCGNPKNRS
jgi:hypothetical protein